MSADGVRSRFRMPPARDLIGVLIVFAITFPLTTALINIFRYKRWRWQSLEDIEGVFLLSYAIYAIPAIAIGVAIAFGATVFRANATIVLFAAVVGATVCQIIYLIFRVVVGPPYRGMVEGLWSLAIDCSIAGAACAAVCLVLGMFSSRRVGLPSKPSGAVL